ncbi:MAG: hypothetical protein HZA23_01025 [Nitrospirae bacterium]|nr:hypothetical protein [Nitrospirota bacterium]
MTVARDRDRKIFPSRVTVTVTVFFLSRAAVTNLALTSRKTRCKINITNDTRNPAVEQIGLPLEGGAVESVEVLKERFVRTIALVRKLKEEKQALDVRVRQLERELAAKTAEMQRMDQDFGSLRRIQEDLQKHSEERVLIRSRVDQVLRELEGVEFE